MHISSISRCIDLDSVCNNLSFWWSGFYQRGSWYNGSTYLQKKMGWIVWKQSFSKSTNRSAYDLFIILRLTNDVIWDAWWIQGVLPSIPGVTLGFQRSERSLSSGFFSPDSVSQRWCVGNLSFISLSSWLCYTLYSFPLIKKEMVFQDVKKQRTFCLRKTLDDYLPSRDIWFLYLSYFDS